MTKETAARRAKAALRRQIVSDFHARGMSPLEIVHEMGVSIVVVTKDLDALKLEVKKPRAGPWVENGGVPNEQSG